MIARNKNKFSTEEFLKLYNWMKENNNNFKDEPERKDMQEPINLKMRAIKITLINLRIQVKRNRLISNFIFHPMVNQTAQTVHLEQLKNLHQLCIMVTVQLYYCIKTMTLLITES